MRRSFSISIILLLWLGPLAAVLPSVDESRLPVCCRRHGAHHCEMFPERVTFHGVVLRSPSQCPAYPRFAPATVAPQFALTTRTAMDGDLCIVPFAPRATRVFARLGQLLSESGRGPPTSLRG